MSDNNACYLMISTGDDFQKIFLDDNVFLSCFGHLTPNNLPSRRRASFFDQSHRTQKIKVCLHIFSKSQQRNLDNICCEKFLRRFIALTINCGFFIYVMLRLSIYVFQIFESVVASEKIQLVPQSSHFPVPWNCTYISNYILINHMKYEMWFQPSSKDHS